MNNNYIKSKVCNYLLGKRCPSCFSSYSKDSFSIMSSLGFSNKQKFLFRRPAGQSVAWDIRMLFWSWSKDDRMYDLSMASAREVAAPVKFRLYVPVLSIEICCEKCRHTREIELDMQSAVSD